MPDETEDQDWRDLLAEVRVDSGRRLSPAVIEKRKAAAEEGRIRDYLHRRMQYAVEVAEVSKCPMVQLMREIAVSAWNEYARSAWKKEAGDPSYGKEYGDTYRGPRFSRRRSLSHYDNRRDRVIVDRYYLGIYPME